MIKNRFFIKVEGIVQGVGFRPFVYNLAHKLNLKGWVNNNSEGVYIDIEGSNGSLNEFLSFLKQNPPPLAKIENISFEEKELLNFTEFVIKESIENLDKITLISPDIAICEDCRNDILDPLNRRYGYAFTNCTNCGPRFSIIKNIPYDRDKTTMQVFEMCDDCKKEYTDPTNRRFHAQPNACKKCGPHLYVTDINGTQLELDSPIKFTADKLLEGHIFAIKGLSGFHLVCNGLDSKSIDLLRTKKKRPWKPFAVMMKDLTTVKKYCAVSESEEKLLAGIRKPIVLLNKLPNCTLPQNIAPNQKTLGVMLPYTPMHELLFHNTDVEVLIMTSANIHGLPLEYTNEGALKNLMHLVDYYLMHNRDIFLPVDDSVVKVTNNSEMLIRRARGYAPEAMKLDSPHNILACGSNMKNTFCISKSNFVFLSSHIGDLENLETFEHYKKNVAHYEKIFTFKPEYIAYDMHPDYMSTEYASEQALPKIPIQHHHAHAASCMFENKLKNKTISICFDGTGYGTDNKIWGGEFLICDLKSFTRIGHLAYIKMPGGEKAVKEPWRMAISYIYETYRGGHISSKDFHYIIEKLYGKEALSLINILDRKINCPETSSMGRFFDAISSMLGIRNIVTYEGQASIELEACAFENCNDYYSYNIKKITDLDDSEYISEDLNPCENKINYAYIIEPFAIINGIINDILNVVPNGLIAAKFHNTIVEFTVELCNIIRINTKLNDIVLSGGVFQNSYLLSKTVSTLKANGFKVYTSKAVPSNDGGISLGQLAIANELLKSSEAKILSKK